MPCQQSSSGANDPQPEQVAGYRPNLARLALQLTPDEVDDNVEENAALDLMSLDSADLVFQSGTLKKFNPGEKNGLYPDRADVIEEELNQAEAAVHYLEATPGSSVETLQQKREDHMIEMVERFFGGGHVYLCEEVRPAFDLHSPHMAPMVFLRTLTTFEEVASAVHGMNNSTKFKELKL
jgi:hypothetical protein